MRRRCGGLLAGWLLLWAPLAQAAPPALQPCRLHGVAHEALCGSVSRALDPADERGVRIDVHFAVLPALARQPKPDALWFVAGGPGQSAIALAGPVGAMLARFGNRRDIVLVDQRGTGRSAALPCPQDAATLPLAEAIDPVRQLQRARTCLAGLQALPHGDLRHYTTAIAAMDLEAVREALGAPRLNLVGASYGTRVVLEYMRRYPQRVRRAVLDGVAPPDMALPWASAPDAQAAFDALLRSCEAEAACRARHARLREHWAAVLASMPRELALPHPASGRMETLTMTRDMLLGLVRSALYAPATASVLPAALDEAVQGRFAPLVGLASVAAPRGRHAVQALAQGMHFSVVCSEDMPSAAQWTAPAPAPDFGRGLAPLYQQLCRDWPRGQVDEAFRQLPPAPVATLLLSGGIDPATPPRHGERVARALGAKARHEVVPNAGHGLLALPCVRELVYRFVDAADDAAALALDTGCARDVPRPPAFVPPGAGAAP
ncbi:MAG TPA: alpha/beta fold hydrolase [Rubrivivax sp.]|nr:alpha/beta fold hydrolase [Rubrivivax sp.]